MPTQEHEKIYNPPEPAKFGKLKVKYTGAVVFSDGTWGYFDRNTDGWQAVLDAGLIRKNGELEVLSTRATNLSGRLGPYVTKMRVPPHLAKEANRARKRVAA